jgi:hypothetical protein
MRIRVLSDLHLEFGPFDPYRLTRTPRYLTRPPPSRGAAAPDKPLCKPPCLGAM